MPLLGHSPQETGLKLNQSWAVAMAVLAATTLALPAAAQAPPGQAASVARSDYVIGLQDLLQIRVFGVDELSQIVRVAGNGSIDLPLLGPLEAAGRTRSELQALIALRLEQGGFINDPQVTVFVMEYESKKIAVTGAVRSPGAYEMLGRKTLLEMISRAGGLRDGDVGSEIVVFRQREDGTMGRISVDVRNLVYHADAALNILVESSDMIYVPAVEKMEIFVTGAVNHPDRFYVRRDKSTTVLRAITLAGGPAPRASLKRVQVLRARPDGSKMTLTVNLKKVKKGQSEDLVLKEDDVVMVPRSFF